MKQLELDILQKVKVEMEKRFGGEASGHDWWHIARVFELALKIGKAEKADLFVVGLAALLHDVADWKFHDKDEMAGAREARKILKKYKVGEEVTEKVCEIIATVSFKGAGVKKKMKTLEGKVVQDADRLDALGAIGIARVFAYGGHAKRALYDPAVKPKLHKTKEEYFNNQSSSLNHFYEKILLLKDLMNTKKAKAMALGRHKFVQAYLKRFLAEWKGRD